MDKNEKDTVTRPLIEVPIEGVRWDVVEVIQPERFNFGWAPTVMIGEKCECCGCDTEEPYRKQCMECDADCDCGYSPCRRRLPDGGLPPVPRERSE